MRVMIVRRERGPAASMDVYADNLVANLKMLHPDWSIAEIAPEPWSKDANLWHSGTGLKKYYERFWRHPHMVGQQTADLFHVIDQSNAHVAYWLKKLQKPVVVTCHDMVHFACPNTLYRARFPALSLASWKFSVGGMKAADQVISVSADTAKDITKMLNIEPERITVVPNGINQLFRPLPDEEIKALRQRFGASEETFCLLNVGSVHPRKNIPTVLEVLKILIGQNVPVQLWRVGDEFTTEQNAFVESHNLGHAIKRFGQHTQEELLYLYNASDLLLAPSLYEGFGLTPLEAMACGTPVISANISAIPEVVGDAGVLVDDPLDAKNLAEVVQRLLRNSDEYNTLVTKGLKRAKSYTWLRTAEQVSLIYDKVIRLKDNCSKPVERLAS